MRTIPLTNGKETLVDDDDFEWASHFRWSFSGNGYAYNTSGHIGRYLHRMVMEPCEPFVVDHINGNRLDNRKCNLRLCTHQENAWHRRQPSRAASGAKGVTFVPRQARSKPWVVEIRIGRKRIRIGSFETKEEAALAYNEAAKRYHGEFAHLNRVTPQVEREPT